MQGGQLFLLAATPSSSQMGGARAVIIVLLAELFFQCQFFIAEIQVYSWTKINSTLMFISSCRHKIISDESRIWFFSKEVHNGKSAILVLEVPAH